jgi:hypothetical protein
MSSRNNLDGYEISLNTKVVVEGGSGWCLFFGALGVGVGDERFFGDVGEECEGGDVGEGGEGDETLVSSFTSFTSFTSSNCFLNLCKLWNNVSMCC